MSHPDPVSPLPARLARALALPALLAGCMLLAACGGSGTPSNAAATEQSRQQNAEVRSQDFARCLREHGIDAEASTGPGGQGHGLKVKGGPGSGPQQMEAAQKACARYAPNEGKAVNLSPQQKVELEEGVQRFAKCMREHGIKVETSTAGGGVRITVHGRVGEAGPNPESPAFQRAQSSCQKLLPKPPGAKSGPGTAQSAAPTEG